MFTLDVRLGSRRRAGYPVSIARSLEGAFAAFLQGCPRHRRIVVVTEDRVASPHGNEIADRARKAGRDVTLLTFPPGEPSKTRETKALLEDRMLAAGLDRDALLVAVGGGVTLDLAGFTAATFMRGIPFVSFPTTVLAMVDSCVGGKTGVDTPAGKNLVGAFHPPLAVFAETCRLETLPVAEVRAGLAEALKHGLIASPEHWEFLKQNARPVLALEEGVIERVIAESIGIKAEFVAADEQESGARKALNFGHTFAHAIERLSGFNVSHGEAVARGLVAEAQISLEAGHLAAAVVQEIRETLALYDLPSAPFEGLSGALAPPPGGRLSLDAYIEATRSDKKARAGRAEYVLLGALGRVARDPAREDAWTWPVERRHLARGLFDQTG